MKHLISCEVFRHELEFLTSKMENAPIIHFLKQSLHDNPAALTESLQNIIDEIEENNVEEILLCYGVCGRGVSNVRSHKSVLILPKVHDCISLLLGESCSAKHTNVFWMSAGWLEYSQIPFLEQKNIRKTDYLNRFGEDEANYLMEMEDVWLKGYFSARLIVWDNFNNTALQEQAQYVAKEAKLPYTQCRGSSDFLQALLDGGKDERFVRIYPGHYIDISSDGSLVVL